MEVRILAAQQSVQEKKCHSKKSFSRTAKDTIELKPGWFDLNLINTRLEGRRLEEKNNLTFCEFFVFFVFFCVFLLFW